ncbi:maltooligosyl trehalose hydrolase [Nitrosospira sp. Nsp2]|uniref:malto-oligosyltrehalose trehalohydrolase n=1 Tax=Nitrosospira sp. Nsp2 TaxID=136548 RepID=UPI000D302A83|nr:malto-oligosyltrehalose trehalohydrolase [Nitrosospira sp. Nsp2]PTR16182.1 maltooligosyl trehalose hydrolase [Nitrosospira sp. Nsp2]
MPYGAQMTDQGTDQGVRFRLWAPSCKEVALCLASKQADGQHEQVLPMNAGAGGWFELTVSEAAAGTRYGFEVTTRADKGAHGKIRVPDPASRFNPEDVHRASEVIDPAAFAWQDAAWRGRPWEEAVIYELHVGTFSPGGTFDGVTRRLDYLAELGVTAIELMPVADFPGARNWGYDGVLPYAPDSRYGRPEDLKTLVQAAHARGLMVLLDVVYNHFGPEGNYLHLYAREFFTEHHHTPWGAAINLDGPDSRQVREFFIHNALYWLQEYHLDGLRLDAVHAIIDDSSPHFLVELAERVRAAVDPQRHVHLILENDANQARYLGRGGNGGGGGRHDRYTAQWNDDIHHALHVLVTGEKDGYYADYADDPVRHLGRCLAEGFAYQGQLSAYRDHGPRGEDSAHLPPQAFVSFLQCHDQVGNRAFGERITHIAQDVAVRAAASIYLLAPGIPMLFMGEEFAARAPFLFFCDFGAELRDAVTQGRRREFARFARFADTGTQAEIPDPNEEKTFLVSKIDWDSLHEEAHAGWLGYYRDLLKLRKDFIVPRLAGMEGHSARFEVFPAGVLNVDWRLGDGSTLRLLANFSDRIIRRAAAAAQPETVFASSVEAGTGLLAPWAVVWTLEPPATIPGSVPAATAEGEASDVQ